MEEKRRRRGEKGRGRPDRPRRRARKSEPHPEDPSPLVASPCPPRPPPHPRLRGRTSTHICGGGASVAKLNLRRRFLDVLRPIVRCSSVGRGDVLSFTVAGRPPTLRIVCVRRPCSRSGKGDVGPLRSCSLLPGTPRLPLHTRLPSALRIRPSSHLAASSETRCLLPLPHSAARPRADRTLGT
ncbi:hypothetical protein BDW22DRAFT_1180681 [Trametopsis cervina]|nr:hypothetical protein BDW22DRAFT_1180681 [Trametopsis cervina]